MKRHSSRILPTALAAVLVLGACGGTDDDAAPDPPGEAPADGGLRAPSPVRFTAGSSGRVAASAEGAMSSADAMIAPWFNIEYLLGEGLVAPTDDTGYVYDAGGPLTAEQVAALAAALGVEGEPLRQDDPYYVSWRVGPDDGSAPSLWVSEDAQQWWNYSSAWNDASISARYDCAIAIDDDGNEGTDDCPEIEPPTGVPTAAEAEQRATEILTALGVDLATVEFDTYADEWSASVTASSTADARTAINSWNFGFGGDGVLQWAGGSLAMPAAVGPYPLVDIETAFARLQDQSWGGFMARGGDIAVSEPAVAMPEVGEPAVLPMPGDDSMPEPETLTVTLVDVQADLWWAWDIDGTVWLLPAYRFIGDDGGWYTVPAVTDEYLIQVDEPMPVEPMPGDPDDGTGGSTPGWPGDDVAAIADLVGLPLDDFIALVGDRPVRVVERDGEQLMVTEDFNEDRINVVVVTRDGVEIVVKATTDVGYVIAEIVLGDGMGDDSAGGEVPMIDDDPMALLADVQAAFDGQLPLSLDEFTARATELGYETRVVVVDGEPQAVTMDYRLDRVNVEVDGGQVVLIDSVG